MGGRSRKASQNCHNPPTDQYSCNPDTCTELVQQQVARYLKNEIAPIEYARQEPELLASDSQLLVHRQRRKPNVDPVNEVNDEENKDKRDDVPLEFAECSSFGSHNYRRGLHSYLW